MDTHLTILVHPSSTTGTRYSRSGTWALERFRRDPSDFPPAEARKHSFSPYVGTVSLSVVSSCTITQNGTTKVSATSSSHLCRQARRTLAPSCQATWTFSLLLPCRLDCGRDGSPSVDSTGVAWKHIFRNTVVSQKHKRTQDPRAGLTGEIEYSSNKPPRSGRPRVAGSVLRPGPAPDRGGDRYAVLRNSQGSDTKARTT